MTTFRTDERRSEGSAPPVHSERELIARVALLEAFVEASSDALFSLGPDQRITTWNRGASLVFGYSAEEAIGEATAFLVPDHLGPQVARLLATVSAGDRVHHVEIELRRRDGMPVPVSLSLDPVLDDQGRVTASVAVARDITEQRVGQAVLAEMDLRLCEGEALAHVGRWLWDVGTGAVQWSDEMHRIHAIDPLAFEGTLDAHVRCIHAEDRERVRASMASAVASGRSFEDEYRVVRPDGEARWIYCRAEPTVGSDQTVVGLRGIGHDVTDRRASTS